MSEMMTAIYGSGLLYSGGSAVIADLKNSGFTTVIAWSVHVNTKGDLSYNDTPIVSNGSYIGDPEWPKRLSGLKQGGSVNRLLFSVGSADVSDYSHIQSLIRSQGTGPNSILHQNFLALKRAIPAIDGIDFDDEDLNDQDTIVQFAQMLNLMGYQVTFCPYTNSQFWIDCLHTLNSKTPGLVTGFNLQCYAGGTGNNPQEWITVIANQMGSAFDADGFVYPGLWGKHGDGCADGDSPHAVRTQFEKWRSTGIQGGFVWLYDDIQTCARSGGPRTAAYASAIINGLGAGGQRSS
jgi:hypothetical protein